MSNSADKPRPFNALKYSGLKPRKVFLKNEKYESTGTVVICIETTCSYSSKSFKAVYIGETGRYQNGDGSPRFQGFFGQVSEYLCSNFIPYNGEIIL